VCLPISGYYDRVLANVPTLKSGGPTRICLIFDDEVDDSVPIESHDELIDVIVTPSHVFRIT
jgi:5-formyltetrahydrofolate cyclo-ligase